MTAKIADRPDRWECSYVRRRALALSHPQVTPTKMTKLDKEEKEIDAQARRDCIMCKPRTIRICSECQDEGKGEVFICNSGKQRVCVDSHTHGAHS
jgi:hypothetical protein